MKTFDLPLQPECSPELRIYAHSEEDAEKLVKTCKPLQNIMKRFGIGVPVYVSEYVAPGKPVIAFHRRPWDKYMMLPELKVNFDEEKLRTMWVYKGCTPEFITILGGTL